VLEYRLAPASLILSTLADNTTDTSHLTLREAITLVNSGGNPSALGQTNKPAAWAAQISGTFGSNDSIIIPNTLYSNSIKISTGIPASTMQLNGTQLPTVTTQLTITGDNTPNGFSGVPVWYISGQGESRVFQVGPSGNLTLNNLVIEHGSTNDNGGGIPAAGPLTLDIATVSNNTAAGSGGGIMATGPSLTLTNVGVSSNTAADGGGIKVSGASVTISNSIFTDNTVQGSGNSVGTGDGGGLDLEASGGITLSNDTFSGNVARGGNGGNGGKGADGTTAKRPGGHINASKGSVGGNGGDAAGGGLYVGASSSLTLSYDTFSGNSALGGNGGNGGNGGDGAPYIDPIFHIGNGAAGGAGGNGGSASGGGLYITGSSSVTLGNDNFSGNKALGANCGQGGQGGQGGQNHSPESGGSGGPGGAGGAGAGGGVYLASGNVTLSNDSLSGNIATGSTGGQGGQGGQSGTGLNGAPYAPPFANFGGSGHTGGIGGPGGPGGLAGGGSGGGLYVAPGTLSVSLTNDTLSANNARGGTGGAGGTGGTGSTGGKGGTGQPGGIGGIGGKGGIAGPAGQGADGIGAGLYDAAGIATLTNDTLSGNNAVGGSGGRGGTGGTGGIGGQGGDGGGGANGRQGGKGGSGRTGGSPGAGNNGGLGGNGYGGGLYVAAAELLTNDTLAGNSATAGAGGPGGPGGHGGDGGTGGTGVNGEPNGAKGNNEYPIVGYSPPSSNGGLGYGGGLFTRYLNPGPSTTLSMANTLIAQNTSTSDFPDAAATINNSDHDLLDNFSTDDITNSNNDILNLSAGLAELPNNGGPLLADNGGPLAGAPGSQKVVQTIALVPGSPALGAGDTNAGVGNTDDRGLPRISGNTVDIGAFEFQRPVLVATLPNSTLGAAYPRAITVAGDVVPCTFAVTAGAAPTGLTLNADGTWSGTAAAAGPFSFTVTATDQNVMGSQAYTVTIAQGTPTVSVTDGGTYNGNPYSAVGSAIGIDGHTAVSGSFSYTYYAAFVDPVFGAIPVPIRGAPTATGSYLVTAAFTSSDPNYTSASSARTSFTIGQASPRVSVADASGTYSGNPFAASATAVGVDGVTTVSGSFSYAYYVGSSATGTPSGTPPTSAGAYTVVASFTSSDPNYTGGSAQATFTINPDTTSVAVSASSATPAFRQNVTLTATVTTPAGEPIPTSSDGMVTFYDGTTVLGTATLSGSPATATLSSTALALGPHTILASYSGDSNFAASPLGQSVVGATGLKFPESVAVDGQGDVFIADTDNNQIVEVTPSGAQTAFTSYYEYVGSFPAQLITVNFNAPTAVWFNQGYLSITDGTGALVEMLSSGSLFYSNNGVHQPANVANDGLGDVFTAEPGNNQVVEVKADGTQTTVGSGLNQPSGVAADGKGNLFIADSGNNRVVEVMVGVPVTVVHPRPTVSVSPVNITYGTTLDNSQLSGTATFTAGGSTVNVQGTFTYTSAGGTVLDGGNWQTEAVTFTPNDTGDYSPASITVAVNVAQATPTVSVIPVNITFGTALDNSQLSGTATWTVGGNSVPVPGTFTFTSAAGTVLNPGAGQSETVTFTPGDSTNYSPVATTVTVNVAQATPILSVKPVSIIFGTPLANGQLSGTATSTVGGNSVNVPGTFTYTSAAGKFLKAANGQSETVTFTPTDSTNYATASATVSVNVAQDTPTLSVNPVNITYGTALDNSQLGGTATWSGGGNPVTVAGTFTYTSAAGTILGTGSGRSEAVSFTPTDSTDYATVATTVSVTVNSAVTTTSAVTLSSLTAVYGQPIRVTARVSNTQTAATASGTVTFYDGSTVLGTAPVGTSGIAILPVSSLDVGKHTIAASFSDPAGNFTPSGSPFAVSVRIAKAGTTTALTATTNTTVFGQPVTFTANVAAVAPSTTTPTGSVTFKDGNTVFGTVSLSGGSASFTTSLPSTGHYSITATYTGTTNFGASSSAATAVGVSRDATTAVIRPSVSRSFYGQAVTLTAMVTASSPGSGTPTGSVRFYDGNTLLGTATLTSGTASVQTTALALGGHSFTVVYGGSANFLGTTSAALVLPVNKAITTTMLTSSSAMATKGAAVTFTATVLPLAPGAGTPTGKVEFMDGSTLIGKANLIGGVARLTYRFSASNRHQITAVYSGDADFLPGTSAVLTETIN
jgi:hypothetical protein